MIVGTQCYISSLFSSSNDSVKDIYLPEAQVGQFYQATTPYFAYHYKDNALLTPRTINRLSINIDNNDNSSLELSVAGIPELAGTFELSHSIEMTHPSMCSSGFSNYYHYKLKVLD